MENKINIAKILSNCPRGMELDCSIYNKVTLINVDDREDIVYPIRVFREDGNTIALTKYGQYTDADFAKCVIFPKGKTTWEGFVPPCKFKDGDVIYTKTYDSKWISIFEKFDDDECKCYIDYSISSDTYYGRVGYKNTLCEIDDIVEQRLATEEEKQKLFDAIKENGHRWNSETNTLVKLVQPKFKVGDVIQDIDTYKVKITAVNIEDECYEYESTIAKGIGSIPFIEQDNWELIPNKFDISALKPFESKVLVRNSDVDSWCPAIFGCKRSTYTLYKYATMAENYYAQCIPYEENKHLIGTTDDCNEYFKIWV